MRHRTNCRGRTTNSSVAVTVTHHSPCDFSAVVWWLIFSAVP